MLRRISSVLLLAAFLLIPFGPARLSTVPGVSAQLGGTPFVLTREWYQSTYGYDIGSYDLIGEDINGDGEAEIIAIAQFGYDFGWYVVQRVGPDKYTKVWSSPFYPGTAAPRSLAVADVDADGITEIFVGFADAKIRVYRGSDFKETSVFAVEGSPMFLTIADIDGSGTPVILASHNLGTAAYSAIGHTLLWYRENFMGELAVGNVDNDPAPEIVSSLGSMLDGVTLKEEWKFANILFDHGAEPRLHPHVQLGDLDNDGIQEIVSTSLGSISIYDADVKSPGRLIRPESTAYNIDLADANGDGILEILYIGRYEIVCLQENWDTYQQLWKVSHYGYFPPQNFSVTDFEGDGNLEVIWGGENSAGDNSLSVVSVAQTQTRWKSPIIGDQQYSVAAGDVDDDGDQEIVMVPYTNYSRLYVYNGTTHQIEGNPVNNNLSSGDIETVRIADIDSDGETEIIISGGNGGGLQVFNGRTREVENRTILHYDTLWSFEIGDVDLDGKLEIVVGEGCVNSSNLAVSGTCLAVLDGKTLTREWQSPIQSGATNGKKYDVHLANLDSDPQPEMAVSEAGVLSGGNVLVYDGLNHRLEAKLVIDAFALSSEDIDKNGIHELAVGARNGRVYFYAPNIQKTYVQVSSFLAVGSPVTCLQKVDLDQDGSQEWLICNSKRLTVFHGQTRQRLWIGEDMGMDSGLHNHIAVADVDRDGAKEVIIGSYYSLYQFQAPWIGPIYKSNIGVSSHAARPGTNLRYSINVVNSGPFTLTDAQVSSPLPEGVDLVDGSLSDPTGSAVYENGVISWSGAVESQTTLTITYQVTVRPDVPAVTTLTSTAQITSGSYTAAPSTTVTVATNFILLPLIRR